MLLRRLSTILAIFAPRVGAQRRHLAAPLLCCSTDEVENCLYLDIAYRFRCPAAISPSVPALPDARRSRSQCVSQRKPWL